MNLLRYLNYFSLLLVIVGFLSCRKGEINADGLPDTRIAFDEINLTGADRLNSSVRLSWFGSDADGYVVGYEISLDQSNWFFTEENDSTFLFEIPRGRDTADIDFYVRSIDNDGNIDPTPALLQIPLRNTPPVANFVAERTPKDTAFIAATVPWSAFDPDGPGNLESVEIKINDGSWTAINLNETLLSFLPDTSVQSGEANSEIYYGLDQEPSGVIIDGMRVNDQNQIFIRAFDIADTVSLVDTTDAFYFKPKTPGVDILLVSLQDAGITQEYTGYFRNNNLQFDLLNYGQQFPNFFETTVPLIFNQYRKAFINIDAADESSSSLNLFADLIQSWTNRPGNLAGKYFITTSFSKSSNIQSLTQVYPISALSIASVNGAQARIPQDSALTPLIPGSYPDLSPVTVEFDIVPIIGSSDAIDFYRAELQLFRGWNGPSDIVATARRRNGKIAEVFFAQQLHDFDQDPSGVEQLIGEIFKNEF